ncbi:MAG: hypothetical protein ACPGVG_16380 [Mycobacterium sp.]
MPVHAYRGAEQAGIPDHRHDVMLELIASPWCPSLFAFVGGRFVARAVRQRGVGNYVRSRVAQFFSIYLIWTALQFGGRVRRRWRGGASRRAWLGARRTGLAEREGDAPQARLARF